MAADAITHAASALAGGRIDTPLKETPSAISVLTAEFLEDIGATSFGSAAEWAPNSIPVGETATFGEHQAVVKPLGRLFQGFLEHHPRQHAVRAGEVG